MIRNVHMTCVSTLRSGSALELYVSYICRNEMSAKTKPTYSFTLVSNSTGTREVNCGHRAQQYKKEEMFVLYKANSVTLRQTYLCGLGGKNRAARDNCISFTNVCKVCTSEMSKQITFERVRVSEIV
jgi:hypothetical protein